MNKLIKINPFVFFIKCYKEGYARINKNACVVTCLEKKEQKTCMLIHRKNNIKQKLLIKISIFNFN
jgi:hypothetical protein